MFWYVWQFMINTTRTSRPNMLCSRMSRTVLSAWIRHQTEKTCLLFVPLSCLSSYLIQTGNIFWFWCGPTGCDQLATKRTFLGHCCIAHIFIFIFYIWLNASSIFIIPGKMEVEYVISKKLQLKKKAEVWLVGFLWEIIILQCFYVLILKYCTVNNK